MESHFGIRAAVIEDALSIAQVNYLTWLDTFRGLIPDLELDSLNLESLIDRWKQNLSSTDPRSITFIVATGDSLIAYARFYPSLDPDDDPNQVATIGSMYVNPKFQRQGIGRELMWKVLECAKEHGFTGATLHVLAANERARNFYENLGWKQDLVAEVDGSDEGKTTKVRYRKNLP